MFTDFSQKNLRMNLKVQTKIIANRILKLKKVTIKKKTLKEYFQKYKYQQLNYSGQIFNKKKTIYLYQKKFNKKIILDLIKCKKIK